MLGKLIYITETNIGSECHVVILRDSESLYFNIHQAVILLGGNRSTK